MINQWIVTLLLIAAFALFPSWLVGALALGGAVGLWVGWRLWPKPTTNADSAPQPEPATQQPMPKNVIPFRRKGGDHAA